MKINVAYSADNNYFRQLSVAIFSMLENNQEIEYIDIYVIDNGILNENKNSLQKLIKKYKNRNIIFLDFDKLCDNLKTDGNFPISSFARLFLWKIKGIDKIIYMDCDSLVIGELKDLWNIDINDYYVAGVLDNVHSFYKTSIGLEVNDNYINAGFLLINIERWRKDNLGKKCIDVINTYKGTVPHNDQGVINKICHSKLLLLPPKYNLQCPMFNFTVDQIKKMEKLDFYYDQKEIEEAKAKPIFIHYTTDFFNRPWNQKSTHPLKEIYLNYLQKTPFVEKNLENKELPKNTKIMYFLYKLLPFDIYLIINNLVKRKKEARLRRRYEK